MVLWLRYDSQKEGVNESVTSPLLLAAATTGLVRLGLPWPPYIPIYKLQTRLLSLIITKHKWTWGFLDAAPPSQPLSSTKLPNQIASHFVTFLPHLTTSKTSNKGLALFFLPWSILCIYLINYQKGLKGVKHKPTMELELEIINYLYFIWLFCCKTPLIIA